MTYNVERAKVGHEPFDIIEMDLDICDNVYSVAPCTASLGSGLECTNTFQLCQDQANYVKTTKTYKFSSKAHAVIGEKMYPCVNSVKLSPAIAESGKIGVRAKLTVKLTDFPHNDVGTDPYFSTRSYTPIEQGTFWGKFIARNPFYVGRTLRYKKGYFTDPFDAANFQTRTFVIEKISGPDNKGQVTIECKDLLKIAENNRVTIPAASTGTMAANITDVATALSVNAGEGAAYGASGTLRVGNEEMTYSRSTDAFTVVRGVNGTTAEEHDADDLVQDAKVWTAVNAVDILHEILTDFVGIDESRIPYDAGLAVPTGTNDEWDDEKETWILSNNLTRTISSPMGAKDAIEEILEQNNLLLWHDQVSDEIKLKATVPPLGNATLTTYSESLDLISNSTVAKKDESRRISEVWVYYGKIDNTEDAKASNYKFREISSDTVVSGVNGYNEPRRKVIFADWLPSQSLVRQLGGRLSARYALTPAVIDFELHAKKGDLSIGDLAIIDSDRLQDVNGANIQQAIQIISKQDAEGFRYRALTSSFQGRYGFIGPNSLGDYSAETDANKARYAFISLNTGKFADDTRAYKII